MKTEVRNLSLSQEGYVQCYKWIQEDQSNKGVVLIVHGLAEHAERYQGFASKLTADKFIVYAHNQRGHKGSIISMANFGYASDGDNFDILISDVYEIIELIKVEHPNLPIFLIGHSMGSFIVQRISQLYGNKINGIILSGSSKNPNPLVIFGLNVSRLIVLFKGREHRSKILKLLTFDSFNNSFKPNRTNFDWLNRDINEVDKYVEDEFCGGLATASFYKDFFKCILKINKNYELISKKLPIFIISGSMDPVGGCSKDVTKLYKKYKSLEISDLEFKLYPEARHEIFLELNKDEVMTDCINWLNKRITILES